MTKLAFVCRRAAAAAGVAGAAFAVVACGASPAATSNGALATSVDQRAGGGASISIHLPLEHMTRCVNPDGSVPHVLPSGAHAVPWAARRSFGHPEASSAGDFVHAATTNGSGKRGARAGMATTVASPALEVAEDDAQPPSPPSSGPPSSTVAPSGQASIETTLVSVDTFAVSANALPTTEVPVVMVTAE
jgi:hypothetical protein